MANDSNDERRVAAQRVRAGEGAPAQQSTAAAPPAAGTEVNAPVVERTAQDGEKQRGIMVNGKFFAVELPPEVKTGDVITAKAVQEESGIAFVFVRKETGPAGERPPPLSLAQFGIGEGDILKAAKALTAAAMPFGGSPVGGGTEAESALKEFLTGQTLQDPSATLRQLLRLSSLDAASSAHDALRHPITDPVIRQKTEKLAAFLSELEGAASDTNSPVASARADLQAAAFLAADDLTPAGKAVGDAASKALELIAKGTAAGPAVLRAKEAVDGALRALAGTPDGAKDPLRAPDEEKLLAAASKELGAALTAARQPSAPAAVIPGENSISKLLTLLASSPDRREELRAKLIEVVGQQLSMIDTVKDRILKIMNAPAGDARSSLLATLSDGERLSAIAEHPATLPAAQFAIEFKIDLERDEPAGGKDGSIRSTLEQGLATARTLLERMGESTAPEAHDAVRYLRLIEAQSEAALGPLPKSDPGGRPAAPVPFEPLVQFVGDLADQVKAQGYEGSAQALTRIDKVLRTFGVAPSKAAGDALLAANAELSAALESEIPQGSTFRPLLKAVQSAVNMVVQSRTNLPQIPSAPPPGIPSPSVDPEAELGKLLDSLRAKGALTQILELQIERLDGLEPALKELLSSSIPQRMLGAVADTLSRIELVKDPKTPLEKKFNEFIIALRESVAQLIKENASPSETRSFLEEALRTMYRDFGLTPLEERVGRPAQGEGPVLPPQQVNALRGLEVQIKLLLELPDEYFDGAGKDALFQQILPTLDEYVTDILPAFKETDGAPALFLAGLKTRLEDLRAPEKSGGEVRRDLALILKELGELGVISDRGQPGAGPPPSLRQAAILRSLEVLMRTAVAAEHQVIELPRTGAPERILAGLGSAPAGPLRDPFQIGAARPRSGSPAELHAVKEALLDLKTSIPSNAGSLERSLAQFAGRVLENLEQSDSSAYPSGYLRSVLEELKTRFLPPRTAALDQLLARAGSQELKLLEHFVAGQESLARMAPLMQALGEPAVILFPALLSGLITRLEVTAYPGSRLAEEDGEDGGGGSARSREALRRFKFNIELPALGRIDADLACRTKELLISMTCADEAAAPFLSSMLPILETHLRRIGFTRLDLRVGARNRRS